MSETLDSINHALAWATSELRATSATPRLDAELLLAHILGWSRARLLAEGRASLSQAQHQSFQAQIARRAALEPVAYLTGHKEFYGLDLIVDRRVLVPRPETELLVELALDWSRPRITALIDRETRRQGDKEALSRDFSFPSLPASLPGDSPFTIADIGTGSGAIAIALALHLPQARVIATDISPAALELARANVQRHGLAKRVQLVEGDLLEPLPKPVDLLVSNPPYTILAEIDAGVRLHEPHSALDGGADGLAIYRRLLAQAPAHLRGGGALLLEIGATQGAALIELVRAAFPAASVGLHQDLAGRDRVVAIDT